ncbi:hypothetical protein A3H87_04845 [Candidatus Curtissbacteria bacterium RIFCSPLOWO2_02_FULL_42_37]|nr:MAG: hypothetical protein A3E71_01645 [Candidatus Curtissbacteria bacterium RIFCSPHIGHO2_12_FULL_42_33]OGE03245.1 MAG: hypothetical protein A3G16_01700 [Candidatus Curtissbacteria bacterium RIFCSPLOWO2_12_FULL_41_16]OGE11659.1 MAG: hypothetical protein A3H87_04845 [Candidatus Curtissbacteria bacterium RIFCSPLOWO2_02_FULL_42_37]
MKKATILIPALVLLLLASAVYAHGDNSGPGRGNEARFELRVDDDDDQAQKFEIEGQRFEIAGIVSSFSGNTIVVLGQTIMIDPSMVFEFEQKGIINVGDFVKVEGIINDGRKFAREIKVLGEGQGRFKFEVQGVNIQASPSPSASPTPGVSPFPSASPTANVQVEVKANGPVDQVVAFLEQILDFLIGRPRLSIPFDR